MIKKKEGFKGERLVSLPEALLTKFSKNPLIENLYIRKMGFFPKVKFHAVEKEQGVYYYMLLYCVDGKGWYKIRDKKYTIAKNQYVIIPPNQPYEFGADESNPWTIYWFHFCGKLSSQFAFKSPNPVMVSSKDNSRIQDRIALFEELFSAFSMGYIEEYMCYTSMRLYTLLASFLYEEQYQYVIMPTAKEYPFFARVIHYMQENIDRNLTLDELAATFKYSTSHFSMLFHKEANASPINFFIQLKMQKACQYIEMTNYKINEIALKLGFDDPAYFSRIFTKTIGVSPSVYQKRELAFLQRK